MLVVAIIAMRLTGKRLPFLLRTEVGVNLCEPGSLSKRVQRDTKDKERQEEKTAAKKAPDARSPVPC